MSHWTSYHLLGAALADDATTAEQHFAWSVHAVVQGFVHHAAYLAVAIQAANARHLAGHIERRMADLLALDVNPVATLMKTAPDAAAFASRWNGFNDAAPLGVKTLVETDTAGQPTRLRREERDAEAVAELRAHVTSTCIEQARCAADGAANAVAGLPGNLRRLGMTRGCLAELVDHLHADPGASLADCARHLGTASRTLQRELQRVRLRFNGLRQAVRLTSAAQAARDTRASLTEIAQAAGFYDSAHLVHAWTPSCGIPPSRYRQLAQAAPPCPTRIGA